nr:hypothetical protein [Tanacetum cinerariifolium]
MEEDQAGSNPGQSHVVLAGLNPIPMHEDFVATVDSQVHESLKHTTEEHVHIENPLSSSVTLLLMKNLDDPLTFGDQFLNEKLTEDEPGKANVEIKVESMVIVPIHQASSSAPPLSTPIIDLTPPKPVSPPAQEPIFTATTTTTTFLPPPPPQQQSTTVPELATRVFALENICANFKKKHKLQTSSSRNSFHHRGLKVNVTTILVLPMTFSRYGYTYLREIVLRRADYKEYKISDADFKNQHPNNFEDIYLLHLQGKLNHLSSADKVHLFNAINLSIRSIVIRQHVEDLQLGIESYQTKLNLTQPSWDASGFQFKDYTIIHKPRSIINRDMNNQKKMMRETEFNPGMEHRIWSEDDKRRIKEFIEIGAIVVMSRHSEVVKHSKVVRRSEVVKRSKVVKRREVVKQTRRPRSDHGKARHSVSSTFARHNRGSSSHQGDDDEDDGASRVSTTSPTTYLNSLGPLDYQPYEIPTSS